MILVLNDDKAKVQLGLKLGMKQTYPLLKGQFRNIFLLSYSIVAHFAEKVNTFMLYSREIGKNKQKSVLTLEVFAEKCKKSLSGRLFSIS